MKPLFPSPVASTKSLEGINIWVILLGQVKIYRLFQMLGRFVFSIYVPKIVCICILHIFFLNWSWDTWPWSTGSTSSKIPVHDRTGKGWGIFWATKTGRGYHYCDKIITKIQDAGKLHEKLLSISCLVLRHTERYGHVSGHESWDGDSRPYDFPITLSVWDAKWFI